MATQNLTERFAALRNDFPILTAQIDGAPLAYLDSASTSQKPWQVVTALTDFLTGTNANIHRGIYGLSLRASDAYDGARATVARFLNAAAPEECIFVRNTTEAINLVAQTWGRREIGPGDLIVATVLEHHSNLVPWQMLANERGAELVLAGITADGQLDLDQFGALLERRPKLVAVTHASNAIGTITDIAAITRRAHAVGAVVLVDAAQSVPHLPLDVQALGCDFLGLSGHKMLGPTGIGVLYGRRKLLEEMPPFLGGGGMIDRVDAYQSTWAPIPDRFEAGTPAIAEAVALAAAIDYLEGIGMEAIRAHECDLIGYALAELSTIPEVTIFGPRDPEQRTGVISFAIEGVSARQAAAVLDAENIAVRSGQHCAQPLLRALGTEATIRASVYLYSTRDEVDRLVAAVRSIVSAARSGALLGADSDEGCRQAVLHHRRLLTA